MDEVDGGQWWTPGRVRQPITALMRTPEECRDSGRSWARSDLNFFSAGACHILAFVFLDTYPQAGYHPRFIQPEPGFRGSHVYVSNGEVAFDAQGYVAEEELVRLHREALIERQPGWSASVWTVHDPLQAFCLNHKHHGPDGFPGDVWARAQRYLMRFPGPPIG